VPIEWAEVAVLGFGVYLATGALFAVAFHLRGLSRVDPTGGSWGFRVCITPGVVGLWPALAWKWWRGRPPRERNAHRDAAQARL